MKFIYAMTIMLLLALTACGDRSNDNLAALNNGLSTSGCFMNSNGTCSSTTGIACFNNGFGQCVSNQLNQQCTAFDQFGNCIGGGINNGYCRVRDQFGRCLNNGYGYGYCTYRDAWGRCIY